MIGLVVVLALTGGLLTFFGESLLESQAQKLTEAKLENQVLDSEQTALTLARTDLETHKELYDIAKQIVPRDKDQAKTVRELIQIADRAGVAIGSVTFPTSELGNKKAVSKPAEGEEAAKPAETAAPISQADPVTGIAGLYKIDINLVSDGTNLPTYDQLIDFLERLENNRRTSHVGGITVQPDPTQPGKVSFTLTISVFIKP